MSWSRNWPSWVTIWVTAPEFTGVSGWKVRLTSRAEGRAAEELLEDESWLPLWWLEPPLPPCPPRLGLLFFLVYCRASALVKPPVGTPLVSWYWAATYRRIPMLAAPQNGCSKLLHLRMGGGDWLTCHQHFGTSRWKNTSGWHRSPECHTHHCRRGCKYMNCELEPFTWCVFPGCESVLRTQEGGAHGDPSEQTWAKIK